MHVVNNSKSSIACEATDLSLVYLQLQLAQLSLTHLTELNYFTTHISTHPTLLQLRITQLQLSPLAYPTNQHLNSKFLQLTSLPHQLTDFKYSMRID